MKLFRLRRVRRRWLAPAALLPLLLLTCGSGATANSVQAPYPGLPNLDIPAGARTSNYLGGWGNGLSEVARAKQWIKIPTQAAAAGVIYEPRKDYPADDPQGRYYTAPTDVSIQLSSPAGATEGYGIGLPTAVHTVAFGAIPIQVTVQLEQLRDSDDLPVPLKFSVAETQYRHQDLPNVREDATLTGQVRVRLTGLSVDGVDVGLGDCVSAPIDLNLTATPWWVGDPQEDPNLQSFAVGSTEWTTWLADRNEATVSGGGISGQIDIPPFTHCLTKAGEDLSPLLTGSVSGPGNAVTVGIGPAAGVPADKLCGTTIPGTTSNGARAPFRGDPSDCSPDYAPPKLDYPARKN